MKDKSLLKKGARIGRWRQSALEGRTGNERSRGGFLLHLLSDLEVALRRHT